MFKYTGNRLFRVGCSFGSLRGNPSLSSIKGFLFLENTWMCAGMCEDNYRIAKRIIHHRFKWNPKERLAHYCQMATSDQKGLTKLNNSETEKCWRDFMKKDNEWSCDARTYGRRTKGRREIVADKSLRTNRRGQFVEIVYYIIYCFQLK
jgi:hypothetical protein